MKTLETSPLIGQIVKLVTYNCRLSIHVKRWNIKIVGIVHYLLKYVDSHVIPGTVQFFNVFFIKEKWYIHIKFKKKFHTYMCYVNIVDETNER